MSSRSRVNNRTFLPAPVRGVDFRLPLFNLPPEFSPWMFNYQTDNQVLTKRAGHTLAVAGFSASNDNWGMPIVWQSGATTYKFSVQVGVNGTSNGTIQSTTPTGVIPSTADYTVYKDTIFVTTSTTGGSGGIVYTLNPTTLVWTSTFTYTATDGRNPITSYRERVYVGSGTNLFYGGVGAVTGAMTAFSLDGLISGNVRALGKLPASQAFSPEYYLIILSSAGDVLLFRGSYPGGTDWVLVTKFKIPMMPYDETLCGELIETPNDCFLNLHSNLQVWSMRGLLTTGSVGDDVDIASPVKSFFEQASTTASSFWIFKRTAYDPYTNSIYVFASYLYGHPFLALYTTAGLLPAQFYPFVLGTPQQFISFRIDLDDRSITPHSIPYFLPIVQPREAGGFIYAGQERSRTDHDIIKLFDKPSAAVQDYDGSTNINYNALCQFAPVPGPFRQRKLNELIMFSNLIATHSFDYQCTPNFNTENTAFVDYITANTDDSIHENVLDATSFAPTSIVGILEASAATEPFTCYGIDCLFEEAGEW